MTIDHLEMQVTLPDGWTLQPREGEEGGYIFDFVAGNGTQINEDMNLLEDEQVSITYMPAFFESDTAIAPDEDGQFEKSKTVFDFALERIDNEIYPTQTMKYVIDDEILHGVEYRTEDSSDVIGAIIVKPLNPYSYLVLQAQAGSVQQWRDERDRIIQFASDINGLTMEEIADGRTPVELAIDPESITNIASVTKMFTVTVMMQLVDEGRLDLDAPVTDYLAGDLLDGIHVHKGVDYSHQLKAYQLIHQTSGLPDYFEGALAEDFKQNRDHIYSVPDALAIARKASPSAAPDSGKSHYSDTNYQLLGAMIEAITGQSLAKVFHTRIFDRIGLRDTYLYDGDHPRPVEPLPLYFGEEPLSLPLALTSERGAGGIVSTLADSLRFLRAYFDGDLVNKAHFERMYQWNALFFPMQYGYGLMRFKLPRWMTLFRETPELIGHSGSSGSFAFYAPREKLYIAGTFNQFDKPSRPFNFMLKAAAASAT